MPSLSRKARPTRLRAKFRTQLAALGTGCCLRSLDDRHGLRSTAMSESQRNAARSNCLLGALETASRKRIDALLEPVNLKLGDVVCEAGGLLKHAYFPQGSVVSMLTVLKKGSAVETSNTANIGPEGAFGLFAAMCSRVSFNRCLVQLEGRMVRCPIELLQSEFRRSEHVRDLLVDFVPGGAGWSRPRPAQAWLELVGDGIFLAIVAPRQRMQCSVACRALFIRYSANTTAQAGGCISQVPEYEGPYESHPSHLARNLIGYWLSRPPHREPPRPAGRLQTGSCHWSPPRRPYFWSWCW